MKRVLALFLLATLYVEATQIGAFKQVDKNIDDNFCKQIKSNEKFCMKYSVEYPVVSSSDIKAKKIAANINNAIKKRIPASTDAQKYTTDYLKETDGEVFSSDHYSNTEINIFSITNRTFTIVVSDESYTGGAHGAYGNQFYNYDKYTGKPIQLNALFRPHTMKALRAIAEKVYRKKKGLMPYDDLTEKDDWFENKFVLPENIGLDNNGLYLYYMPYEIKAYAYGSTEFVIPYRLLASIAKPNSYLTPLINNSLKYLHDNKTHY